MTEKHLINKIKLITSLCVVFLCGLILAVVFTTISLNVTEAKERELEQQYLHLVNWEESLKNGIEYYENEANLDEIARKVLGWGKAGETIFVR